jgi:hypothetical protein
MTALMKPLAWKPEFFKGEKVVFNTPQATFKGGVIQSFNAKTRTHKVKVANGSVLTVAHADIKP